MKYEWVGKTKFKVRELADYVRRHLDVSPVYYKKTDDSYSFNINHQEITKSELGVLNSFLGARGYKLFKQKYFEDNWV